MRTILVFCLGAAVAGVSHAAVLVNETFDTYATTAQMNANWSSNANITLNVGGGNGGGNAAEWNGAGGVSQWLGALSASPTATENVVLGVDIFDDGTSANERATVGFRQSGGIAPLFEMGHYNAPTFFSTRLLNMYGNQGWVNIQTTGPNEPTAGWNRFEATFTATNATITLDLGADGTIDGTFVSTGPAPANPFGDLRIGGPSGLSSPGGGVLYDNVRLETVVIPEPSVGLLACATLGIGLIARRRRNRWM